RDEGAGDSTAARIGEDRGIGSGVGEGRGGRHAGNRECAVVTRHSYAGDGDLLAGQVAVRGRSCNCHRGACLENPSWGGNSATAGSGENRGNSAAPGRGQARG